MIMSTIEASATSRPEFFRQLQTLTTRIHATSHIDEIMLELSADICELFEADRLTIYCLGEDKASLVSKVKTGLASFQQLKLPISAQSVAGYCALSRKLLNVRDVYDDAELQTHASELRFQPGVDKRTGYRTRQMLVAPILGDNEVVGVVQVINYLNGETFPEQLEQGMRHLCETLAIAFSQRSKSPRLERSRFVTSIRESVLPRAQLEHALRLAESTATDIEEVLLNECGLKVGTVGRALADFFSVPYLGFHPERRRPAALLVNFNREFVLEHQWMPIDENRSGLYILCTDPDEIRRSGAVGRIFPHARAVYCVTTRREFGWMVNQCFRATPQAEADASAAHYRPAKEAAAQPDQHEGLLKSVASMVLGAHQGGLSDVRIATEPGKNNNEIRFTVSGVLTVVSSTLPEAVPATASGRAGG
jgi:putative methionine-R-sulfoxide reductase with GAF domain